jgi:hypothetical protein
MGDLHVRGQRPEGRFGEGKTSDHQRLARSHHRFSLSGFGHYGQSRHISTADVLSQGQGYRAIDLICCDWFHTRSMYEMLRQQKPVVSAS